MLVISGGTFILLCIWHEGKVAWRVFAACVLISVLSFIGWRDLHHPSVAASGSIPPGPPPAITINQTATDSQCSNFIAGSDAQIECLAEEKAHHAKDKSHP
jgi:hypothetical protein